MSCLSLRGILNEADIKKQKYFSIVLVKENLIIGFISNL